MAVLQVVMVVGLGLLDGLNVLTECRWRQIRLTLFYQIILGLRDIH